MRIGLEAPDGRIYSEDKPKDLLHTVSRVFQIGFIPMKELIEAEGKEVSFSVFKKHCMNVVNTLPPKGRLSGGKLRQAIEIAWQDTKAGNNHGFEITEKN